MDEISKLVQTYTELEAKRMGVLGQIIDKLGALDGPHQIVVGGRQLMNHSLSEKHAVAQYLGRVAAPIDRIE